MEKFLSVIYDKEHEGTDLCYYIMSKLDIMLSEHNYDDVCDILNNINLEKVHNTGVPLWILNFSNPVSPLMRKIPAKSDVQKLMIVRCKFYDRCIDYYKKKGEENIINHMRQPQDYDQLVKEYDMLYIGGAPKE